MKVYPGDIQGESLLDVLRVSETGMVNVWRDDNHACKETIKVVAEIQKWAVSMSDKPQSAFPYKRQSQ